MKSPSHPRSGWLPLLLAPLMILSGPFLMGIGGEYEIWPMFLAGPLMILAEIITVFGFQAIAPNQARVFLLFGAYKGSVKESGFFWVNPFYSKKKVSLRIRNFETGSSITHRAESTSVGTTVTRADRGRAGRRR